MNNDLDTAIRLAAFRWLGEAVAVHGDVLPRTLLQRGFEFQDERIPLVSPQGIFKHRPMDLPLSILAFGAILMTQENDKFVANWCSSLDSRPILASRCSDPTQSCRVNRSKE